MIFNSLKVKNWKCFEEAEVDLNRGVTVIHGTNGAGKSSLLEAAHFALYGSKSLQTGDTLEDIVTTGETETEIDFRFTHHGDEYHIYRRIRNTGDRATTADCVLEGPGVHRDGARAVRNFVTKLLRMDASAFVNCSFVKQGEVAKLINADPSTREDIIDDLLQLGKLEDYRERADKTRLGAERVLKQKRAEHDSVTDQIDDKEAENPHAELESIEDDLASLRDAIETVKADLEEAREERDVAKGVLDEYEEKKERLDEIKGELDSLDEEIENAKNKRDSFDKEADVSREEYRELKSRLNTELFPSLPIDVDSVSELIEGDVDGETPDSSQFNRSRLSGEKESLQEKRSEVESELSDARISVKDAESDIQSVEQSIDSKKKEISGLQDDIEDAKAERETVEENIKKVSEEIDTKREKITNLKSEFNDYNVDFGDAEHWLDDIEESLDALRDERTDLVSSISTVNDRIEQAEELMEEGKCPECGQDVDGSPHVDNLDEDREKVESLQSELGDVNAELSDLNEKKESAEDLIKVENNVESVKSDINHLQERVDTLQEKRDNLTESIEESKKEIQDLEGEIEGLESEREDYVSAKEDAEALVSELESEKKAVESNLSDVESAIGTFDDMVNALRDKEQAESKRDRFEEMADSREEKRDSLTDEKEELADELADTSVEEAQETYDEAEERVEQLEGNLESLQDRENSLSEQKGQVKQELSEIESLKKRRENLAETIDRLERVVTEQADIRDMYADLRSELRERNVVELERMLNDVFNRLYQNDAYDRIELSNNYELTVYEKDGQSLSPRQLSGGEKVLFNLSLRCAIYQLLAEGIDGKAPMPPLILDEPTAHLDEGHVERIARVVDLMSDLGVEQTLVVSHDQTIVNSADEELEVENNPTTNRSTVVDKSDSLLA